MLLKCSVFIENWLISYLGKLKWGGTGGEVGRELLGGLFFFSFKEHDCKSKTERSENVSLLAQFS